MPAGPPSWAGAHVFVEDLGAPTLDQGDHHHLARVLRLRPGEVVTASDGQGGWRLCRFSGTRPGLEAEGPLSAEPPSRPPVTVGFALAKGERPEWVVQRLTEAGVDRLVPFVAARSVVRWEGSRAPHHLDRLARVARAAAMQCRRAWLPELVPLVAFRDLIGDPLLATGAALAERGGAPPSLERPTLLVGPEGGFDDEERRCGLPTVGLGPQVMRAETAALAAGVLLCGLRARVVGQVSSDDAG